MKLKDSTKPRKKSTTNSPIAIWVDHAQPLAKFIRIEHSIMICVDPIEKTGELGSGA